MDVYRCDNCGVKADVRLIDNNDEDEVLFCPVCGDEYYEYDDADEIDIDSDD
jgi:predicted RNA-binding Zn-ribbon protein involved in translation (DUF1610 family)